MSLHEQIEQFYPQYHDIKHYPADQCVCIRKTTDEWGIFGNFYHAPITVNGVTFDCTERLFHMMKFVPTAIEGIKGEYAVRRGMNIKHHMKPIYREHPDWIRSDWGKMVVDAMKFCLQIKYEHCKDFRNQLDKTKGFYIVEDETKRNERKHKAADSWGVNLVGDEYVGPSLLGRLLMELRDNGKLDYHLPDDALEFVNVIKKST